MLGFLLEGFQHSFRKRLSEKPKFYFFDTGVTRTLSRRLSIPYEPGNTAYGDVFEHFVLLHATGKIIPCVKYQARLTAPGIVLFDDPKRTIFRFRSI